MNWIKLFMISLVVISGFLLQACQNGQQQNNNSLSLEDISEVDLKAMSSKMKYVQIDGNCYSVVKYHTYFYDIAVHTCIPCEKIPEKYLR